MPIVGPTSVGNTATLGSMTVVERQIPAAEGGPDTLRMKPGIASALARM
jgi:hypothetical protein